MSQRKADRRSASKAKSFRQRLKNESVIMNLRKSGLFQTNEEVIDAALRALVRQLTTELQEATLTNSLPSEDKALPALPDDCLPTGISPDQGVPIP